MSKVEVLTPEQDAYLPAFREEWLQIGLSTKRVDKDAATQAVKRLYAAGGIQEPIVMHFDSPWQCIMAINFMKNRGEIKQANLGENLRENLRENLWANLRDNLRANLWADSKYVSTYFWGGMDAYWVAWGQFAEHIGVPIDKQEHFHAYIDFSKNCGVSYLYPGFAFVSDRPTVLMKDHETRLHCEDGPALAFKDGYEVYTWHGKNVPDEWIKSNPTARDILTETDMEVRAAGFEIIGWANMLDELGAVIVDIDDDPVIGALYEVSLPELEGKHLIAKYTCPRNGVMGQPVPKLNHLNGTEITSILGAKAWMAEMTLEEYMPPEIRT